MNRWEPTQEQWADWEAKGYFVIPGSHKLGIFPHLLYADSIHGELCTAFPPEQVDISEIPGPGLFPAVEETPAPAG